MKKFSGVLVAACLLSGCLSDQGSLSLSAEKAVRAMLKDPASAEFSGAFVVPGAKRGDMQDVAVCGVVNAKNGFGGYSGGERYVAIGYNGQVGDSKLLGISSVQFEGEDRRASYDPEDRAERATIFEAHYWNVMCVDATHKPTFSGEDPAAP